MRAVLGDVGRFLGVCCAGIVGLVFVMTCFVVALWLFGMVMWGLSTLVVAIFGSVQPWANG